MSDKMTTESPKAMLARLKADAKLLEQEREDRKITDEIECLQLKARFEKELGAEGQAFAIYDASNLGEGFFVVKLGPAVLFTTFQEAKTSTTSAYDFVAPCIVHPSKSEFDAAQARRPGINMELAARLMALYGVKIKIDEGK